MADTKKASGTKKARSPRKALTSEQLKEKAAKAELAAKDLLRKAYAAEVDEHIKSFEGSLSTMFKQAYVKFNKRVDDLAILAAIGKLMGVPRLVITQKEPAKRKPKAAK